MSSISPNLAAPPRDQRGGDIFRRSVGLLIAGAIVGVVAILSLRFGSLTITNNDAVDAIFRPDADVYQQTIVRELRLPRTLIAIGVGASLGVAGAIMQAVTRNPLADPSILGISAGAALAMATTTYMGLSTTGPAAVMLALLGACLASIIVLAIGTVGNGGSSHVKLALAGAVVSAFLSSWTSVLLLGREETMDSMRFWLVGSVNGRDLDMFAQVSPLIVLGIAAAMGMGHQLNVLSMGEDNARALGMNTSRMRLVTSGIVIVLTGAAVAVAGPVGFVGLATPHLVRAVVGADYRWILPYSALTGAALLTAADTVGRLIAKPSELQVGIVMALVGAPALIYLARKRTVRL